MGGTESDKKNTVKTHPCEVMYVVVYWLHGFNPFLVGLFVLSTAIVLSANRDTLTCTVRSLPSLRNTLQPINSVHSDTHCHFTDEKKRLKTSLYSLLKECSPV